MTIHKSQGQSFDKIGIYLPKELFTHEQLYVVKKDFFNSMG